MRATDPLQPGSVLAGRYRLGQLLGSGGMAFVHRATDEVLGREVALKAIVRTTTDPVELQRIQSEIDLLATLSHRSLVTLFDAGSTTLDGHAVTFLVMELVDGPALDARLAIGPLAEPDVQRMAQDLAEALVVVHARDVVHRDLKPANILLAPTPLPGREFDAKLADFGIAAIVDAARLTATGTVLGTAAYLSPEQASGARVEPSSDIYSLGLVLLEALTGHREFPGTVLESLGARLTRDPVVPGSIGYEWKSLLTAMTARDPESRPSAAAVVERLSVQTGGTPLPLAGATAAMAPASTTATSILPAAIPGAADVAATAATATTADTAPAAADRIASAVDAPAAQRRRRRRWTLVGSVAAGLTILTAVVAFSLQGVGPSPVAAPTERESSAPASEPTPSAVEPAPAVVEPTTPTPEPAPAVEQPAVQQPAIEQPAVEQPAVVVPATEVDTGDEGNGDGNGGDGPGGGPGGDGNGGDGPGGGPGGDGNAGDGPGGGNGDGGNGPGGGGNGDGGNGPGGGPGGGSGGGPGGRR